MNTNESKLSADDISDAVAEIIDRAIAERLGLDPVRIAQGNPYLGDYINRYCADDVDGDKSKLFCELCGMIDEYELEDGEVRLDEEGERHIRLWLDHNVFVSRSFEVWLVNNGVGFSQGYTGKKDGKGVCLGICDTLDEARAVVSRAAEETIREDGDKTEAECEKFVADAERDLCFDAGDCKYVRVREMHVSEDGENRKFIGAF